jgi:hypothetical protein
LQKHDHPRKKHDQAAVGEQLALAHWPVNAQEHSLLSLGVLCF